MPADELPTAEPWCVEVTDGYLVDADGIEVAIGFGADHSTKVGASGFVVPYGKGQIVLVSLPQQVRSLAEGDFALSTVIAKRLLGNALRAR